MKIRSSGAELFYASGRMDGQTHMTKLIMALRNFANAPKNVATNYILLENLKDRAALEIRH